MKGQSINGGHFNSERLYKLRSSTQCLLSICPIVTYACMPLVHGRVEDEGGTLWALHDGTQCQPCTWLERQDYINVHVYNFIHNHSSLHAFSPLSIFLFPIKPSAFPAHRHFLHVRNGFTTWICFLHSTTSTFISLASRGVRSRSRL